MDKRSEQIAILRMQRSLDEKREIAKQFSSSMARLVESKPTEINLGESLSGVIVDPELWLAAKVACSLVLDDAIFREKESRLDTALEGENS